jgi:hypothetical protein
MKVRQQYNLGWLAVRRMSQLEVRKFYVARMLHTVSGMPLARRNFLQAAYGTATHSFEKIKYTVLAAVKHKLCLFYLPSKGGGLILCIPPTDSRIPS